MKIMISVGEASGDLHGARLAAALKQLQPDITLLGMGGQAMRAAGVELVYDIADLGVMGIVEVIKNLRRLFVLRDELVCVMKREQPDALVVIDYPGFNMRLAKKARELGIPIISYISPSAWAWGKGRAKETAEIVDRVAAIFPFEAKVYEEAGAKVTFVGHPLLDIVKSSMSKAAAYELFGTDPNHPVVLLMPGSRVQEIDKLLPDILQAAELIAKQLPSCQFYLPIASTIARDRIQGQLAKRSVSVTLTQENTYDLMNISNLAIAASGTATLETSLMKVPTVIIYRVNALTYWIGKRLVKIPHIGLPNIVAGRQVVPELLQADVTPQRIAAESLDILLNPNRLQQLQLDLAEVQSKLGESGAVAKAAAVILEVASQSGGIQ
ncbi:lipid-A-disaccharide synthase [Sporomusaceae bacterium BoRhaA]|uniref:lipid-A-disaccharide synthase n=1 Tax=Pelorhabdus rhamnosifermentans TaxID=2772457 RepID=UPI001C063968|nr:lipid-A-disaccharide synthase [Pelorhabdus rhamnosifermentans]MBU2698983.1 lipid-A-disaccharide synthase [Pelorhabdus rhamnosifermentans]